ncbi:YtzC family protein [Bacillus kwashiorkori]|uniref:YtzC family protein n=1 Tax=Bacillus kwashiorkori TaxID=1522318 RepID=UPI000783040E|nr:YtzC family protein [Bacillus kwashiorkori]
MTTRDSLEQFINKCEETLEVARQEYTDGSRQGYYFDDEYSQAQQLLEDRFNELMAMYHSANAVQRERLDRMRLQIQQLQNQMIIINRP